MSATNGREAEDPAVGARRGDVLLLDELHPVGDELGPPVEATGIHRAEPALHVRHDLVLGLADEQRQHEEGREHRDGAQHDLEPRASVTAAPTRVGGTPGAWTRRRPGARAELVALARLLGARATALEARAASTNDLRSGVPSKPSGSRSGRRPRPVPSSKPSKSMPNISWVSRSCQAAPAEDAGQRRRRRRRRATRVRSRTDAQRAGRSTSSRWQTTSKPAASPSRRSGRRRVSQSK